MNQDNKHHKYNHSRSIRQQIRHVNDKIGEADIEDTQSFEQYFNKVLMALASLEATAQPFISQDKEYDNIVQNALENGKPAQMNKVEKLAFIREAEGELMNLFHRQNLFYTERTGRKNV